MAPVLLLVLLGVLFLVCGWAVMVQQAAMWGCADALYAKAGMFMYGLCVFLSLLQAI